MGQINRFSVGKHELHLSDREGSHALEIVLDELRSDIYGFMSSQFRDGDVFIDIGAHVGATSIYAAKLWPGIRILAFEPYPENYDRLVKHTEANRAHNIRTFPFAITSDGRDVALISKRTNSGWTTAFSDDLGGDVCDAVFCKSKRLESVFQDEQIGRCRFLKIDCEGAEHEILGSFKSLGKIDFLAGEFHDNSMLRLQGHTAEKLVKLCTSEIGRENLKITISYC